jgi:hypothetical protein
VSDDTAQRFALLDLGGRTGYDDGLHDDDAATRFALLELDLPSGAPTPARRRRRNRRPSAYAGAAGKVLRHEDLSKLGAGYVLQPKLDGIYGLVATDGAGRIASITTRSGEALGPALLADFAGVQWAPDSLVTAEVELWTQPSSAAAAARGYRMIYPFDAQCVNGRDVSREPYRVRRDALLRAEVDLERQGDDRPWLEDAAGDAHDFASGRYVKPTPLGWRRVRVVPQVPLVRAEQAWSEWVAGQAAGPCEGLVAVALDAQLGAAKSKRKVKSAETIDAIVTDVAPRALTCWWVAGARRVIVSRPRSLKVAPGAVVEIVHEGFYDGGAPRFARLARTRRDLAAA